MYTHIHKYKSKNSTPISTFDISPDKTELVLGQLGKKDAANLSTWSLTDFDPKNDLLNEMGEIVTRVRYSPDGKWLAFSHTGISGIILRERQSKKETKIAVDNPFVNWIEFSQDSSKVIISGTKTQVWSTQKQEKLWEWEKKQNETDSDLLNAKGLILNNDKAVICGTGTASIEIYEIRSGKLVTTLPEAPNHVHCATLSGNEHSVCVIGSYGKGVFIWDIKSGKRFMPNDFNEDMDKESCAALSNDGEILALGMITGYFTALRLKTMEYIIDERLHKGKIFDVRFSSDDTYLACCGEDAIVNIYQKE